MMSERPFEFPSILGPPEPPAELRSRTLAASGSALGAERPDLWTRLWASGAARLVWAVSVACLLFGHVLLTSGRRTEPSPPALPLAVVTGVGGELAEVADLPRVTASLPGFEVSQSHRGSASHATREREERS